MSDTKDDDEPPRRRKPKAPSPYADAPYAVGKGKPPVNHQFPKGGKPGPGRPKNSRNRYKIDKLLAEKVKIGEDQLGRPIRKAVSEVIDRRLIQAAASGDLQAIKLIREFQHRSAELDLRYRDKPPTKAEVLREAADEAERTRLSEELSSMYVEMLDLTAALKKMGIVEFSDGTPTLTAWARDNLPKLLHNTPDNDIAPDEV